MIVYKEDYSSDYMKLQLERFADQIDNQIQNKLMMELMLSYSELSRKMETKNKFLAKSEDRLYKDNIVLEEMVNKKVAEISEAQIATIYALVKLSESRDDDTGIDIERTSELCRLMAKYLSLLPKYKETINDDYIENIYKANPLHDIGKVGIPDSILLNLVN